MPRPPTSPRLAPLIITAVVVAAFTLAGLFHTWMRVESLQLSYALSDATRDHASLMRENERLRLEVATLEAPPRIERLAREQLGMVQPRPQQVVVVPEPPLPPEAPPAATAAAPERRSGILAAIVEVFDGG